MSLSDPTSHIYLHFQDCLSPHWMSGQGGWAADGFVRCGTPGAWPREALSGYVLSE